MYFSIVFVYMTAAVQKSVSIWRISVMAEGYGERKRVTISICLSSAFTRLSNIYIANDY